MLPTCWDVYLDICIPICGLHCLRNCLPASSRGDVQQHHEQSWCIDNGLGVFLTQNKQLGVDIIQELGLSKYFYRQETFTNESGFMIFRANTEGRPCLYITHISFISSSQRRIRWNIEIVWYCHFWIKTSPSLPLDTWHATFPEGAWDPAGALHHILRIYCAWRFPGALDRYQTNKFQLCLQPTNSNKTKFLLEKKHNQKLNFHKLLGSFMERNNHFLPIPAETSLLANLTPSPRHCEFLSLIFGLSRANITNLLQQTFTNWSQVLSPALFN